MKPNNIEITGETTGGACGGERCEGEMPGPTLFLGNNEGQYVLSSHLFIDNRDLSGQSLSRQNLVADLIMMGFWTYLLLIMVLAHIKV